MIHMLAFTQDYPDKDFAHDLAIGIPIAWEIPSTPGLTTRKRNAELPYQELKGAITTRNAVVCDRVLKTQGAELANKCWEKTTREIDLGWITEPVGVTGGM